MIRPEPTEEERAELVEQVAREIHLRGLTAPAVHFLEASRPDSGLALSGSAMLFFDPVLRQVFGDGGDPIGAILADDEGIDRLIDRLIELDEEEGWEA
jgi:hypothetical protein